MKIKIKKAYFSALWGLILVFFNFHLSAQDSIYISPSSTTEIFINGNDSPHYIAINRTINQQNKLLLFFPGTGALTSEYTKFLNTAANLGMHAIGLSYENDISPEFLCLTTPDTTCHDRARNEIIFGWNQHSVVDVDVNNSIYYRTVKLLKYLDTAYPLDNWGQFLNSQDSIIWTKVRVAGHSQGGNHAGFISKLFAVDRCIIFSSRDWMAYYQEPAKWVQRTGLTDSSAYFGFVHSLDANAYGLNAEILVNWSYLNMDGFGAIASVDTLTSPFLNRHMLTSNLPQPQGNTVQNYFHRTVIGNNDTPMDSNNIPIYKPVWEYMLGGNTLTSINEFTGYSNHLVKIYPNPSSGLFYIFNQNENESFLIRIFSLHGELIYDNRNTNTIDLSESPPGIYLLFITNEDGKMESAKIFKYE